MRAIVACALAVPLAGLAPAAQPAAPLAAVPPAGPPRAQRELVVMAEEAHLDSWPVLHELAAEFGREHGVRVELLPLGGAAGSMDKGKFLLAGDVPLDVLRIDVTELAAFVAEGALLDLQPFFDADPTWDPARTFPAVLDAVRDASGHLRGLPSTFTPYVMYVNLDLLAAAGVPEPRPGWTWSDFLDAARRATRDLDGDGRTDVHGISLTQWLQAVVPWVWQNGGELLDPAGERSRMAEPRFVEAMRFLRGLLHEERVASFDASFQNQLSQGLFQAGRAAFYGPVGYWETFRFRHVRDFRWDVVPLPRGERAATAVAMTVYVVPRTSREPELAYRFVRLMAEERYQRTLAEIGNGVPGLVEVARSPSFLVPDRAPESEHVFLDVLEHARFLPPLANWRKIESLCQAELEGILLAPEIDVEAACARMAAKTDAYLARERARLGRPRLPRAVLPLALAGALVALGALVLGRRTPEGARRDRAAWAMVLPWALGFVAFALGPAVVALVLSLCEWSPLRPLDDVRWVGGGNYARLGSDPTFAASLRATVLYALVSVPLGTALALGLAVLLSARSTASAVVRTVCYLPAIVSPVVVGAVWRFVLEPEDGPLNQGLRLLGVEGPAWLRSTTWVLPAFVLVSLWSVGAQMLVFLAALQAVDPALLEAARVDGAGRWRRFLHVTLPSLSPVVLFNLVTGTILAFQVFAQPWVMTQGGPGDASRFLVLYLYETAFRHLDMGYGSALAWVLFLLLAVASLGLMGSSRRWVHYAGRGRA